MQKVVVRLDTEGIETTTVEVGRGATTRRISPRNAKKIQEFADKNRLEITVVGSRVDRARRVTNASDWDYLINQSERITPRKKLRDIERGVPIESDKPYVRFRPRSLTI